MTLEDLRDEATRREPLIRRAAWVVLGLSLLAFVVRGADGPADPVVSTAERHAVPGFPEIRLRVVPPTGGFLEWCALMAESVAARERGLMNQTDLSGYDAMVFRFPAPATDAFYMYDTKIPLSIAWFSANGHFVGSADMAPCPASDPKACPLYHAPAAYQAAIEVPKGELGRLGLIPGSVVSAPKGACR